MPPYIKHWLTTALVSCGLSAQAEVITAQPYDLHLSAYATLTLSTDMLAAFDIIKPSATPVGWATSPVTIQTDPEGFYTNFQTTAPIQYLAFDDQNILGFRTTGGVTLTTSPIKVVSSGGSITLTDLDFDLQSKTIYGKVSGDNGIGSIDHMALWNYTGLSGDTAVNGVSPKLLTLSNLQFTQEGFNAFAQSLALSRVGYAVALGGMSNFGSVSVAISAPLEMGPPPGWYVGQVPEPSTYALMGLGLVGLTLARRRQTS